MFHNYFLHMSKHTHHFVFRLQKQITRNIICSGKQALNQNKFHPPSKQPIAAHLPPFLKHPNRAALGPRHCLPATQQQNSQQVCSAGAWRQTSSALGIHAGLRWKLYRRGKGKGKGKGTAGSTTFSICLMHLRADPILSSDFTLRNTTYMDSPGWIKGS